MGAHHQDGQKRYPFLRQRQDGYWEVSKTNRRNINRQIPLLPQDRDFGWVGTVAASKSWSIFTLILRQLSFKDSLMVCIVMLCVSCHQKQVILVTLLQDWRNLLTAWMMLLDDGGTFWTQQFVVMVWFPRELIDVVLCCTQTRTQKDFQLGSEGCEGCAFHRTENPLDEWSSIRTKHWGPSKTAIEVLEIPVEKNTEEDLHCESTVHTRCRSFLGQINWLQSRTQFQCCYKISRCASKADSPTIGDVKAPNKLARQLKSQPVKLQVCSQDHWEQLHFLIHPTETIKNGSSQKGVTVCLAELREHSSNDGMSYWSVVLYESPKKKPFSQQPRPNCIHEMSWFMPLPPWIVDGLVRCSCRNSHEDWREESGDENKNSSITWTKRKRSTWFPCCQRKLVHEVFMILLTFQLRIVWHIVFGHISTQNCLADCFDKVIGEGRHSDHRSEHREIIGSWRSSQLQDTHGAQGLHVFLM